jgi:hypothetical protein
VLALTLLVACAGLACAGDPQPQDSFTLANGSKTDGAAFRFSLSQDNPNVSMSVTCEPEVPLSAGCKGYLEVRLIDPSPCQLVELYRPEGSLAPRCGEGMDPFSTVLGHVTILSAQDGPRTLDFRLETGDGVTFTTSIAAEFAALPGEVIELELSRVTDAIADAFPDLRVEIVAYWEDVQTSPDETELEMYMASIEGLRYEEIGTPFPGYRAYQLYLTQPLDHANPDSPTFEQQAVLHHRERTAPTILYTSGYELFSHHFLSELGIPPRVAI